MANLHREKLGKRLWSVCEGVYRRGGRCDDGGVRIEGLVDAGADVNSRGVGGNTPLHLVSCHVSRCLWIFAVSFGND